jgi:rhamnogalacturonan endolyase
MVSVTVVNQTGFICLQLSVNKVDFRKPVFDTMQYGRDNAVARHGIHGLYRLWTIDVDSRLLLVGHNSFYLRQRKATGPFTAFMYDYLRLEAPACSSPSGSALAST